MVDNDTGWPVCMRHGDCCRREHEALEPASCCAVERRAFTEPELWCARVYVNLRLRIANAGPTHDLLLGNPRIAALEGPIVTKRFHRAAASKRVSEVKGLVNLEPFCDALTECMRRNEGEEFDWPRICAVVDCMRERVGLGLKLVDEIGGLSDDAVAVAVAASISGSPFRLTALLPLLMFSEKRGRQALAELEELKVIVALEDHYRAFVSLGLEPNSLDGRQAGAHAAPSPREQEVARLVAQGLTNYQIGVRLGLSERTVETYIRRLFRKLNVSSRSQVVAWQMCQENVRLPLMANDPVEHTST